MLSRYDCQVLTFIYIGVSLLIKSSSKSRLSLPILSRYIPSPFVLTCCLRSILVSVLFGPILHTACDDNAQIIPHCIHPQLKSQFDRPNSIHRAVRQSSIPPFISISIPIFVALLQLALPICRPPPSSSSITSQSIPSPSIRMSKTRLSILKRRTGKYRWRSNSKYCAKESKEE